MTAELAVAFLSAFIGALGILFTVGAIFAGWLLYRQSREHAKQQEEFFEKQSAVFGAFIISYREAFEQLREDANRQIQAAIEPLRKEREETRQALEAATAETRAKIEERLRLLDSQIADAEAKKLPELRSGFVADQLRAAASASSQLEDTRAIYHLVKEINSKRPKKDWWGPVETYVIVDALRRIDDPSKQTLDMLRTLLENDESLTLAREAAVPFEKVLAEHKEPKNGEKTDAG